MFSVLFVHISQKQWAPYLHCSLVQEANCGVFHLGFHVHAQKISALGVLWVLNFQLSDAQPVLTSVNESLLVWPDPTTLLSPK